MVLSCAAYGCSNRWSKENPEIRFHRFPFSKREILRKWVSAFMLRQQVLKLYRNFLRTIREVPDEESRKELLQWTRTDFRNNKHHTDEYAIKMLIYHGERQLKQLQQNIAFSR